jgi:POT family proton-dependent oligopeptide transporter
MSARPLFAGAGLYRAIEYWPSHVQHDTGRAVSEARLRLRADLVPATLAVVKEVAEPEVRSAASVSPDPRAPIPKQIRYIIGNEGCERFSFYGMRNILTVFLVSSLLLYLPEGERARGAKDVFHTFVIGVYFFPLLGGWLADRFFGKYHTIFWLSLVYCVGQACLAMFVTNRTGFYIGLGLIALGSGGIKPCVAAFVGDQFDQTNKHRAKVVFDAFYWIINFGSFFASLLMPIFLRHLGPAIAFGVPGVLMFISTAILWAGRRQFVMVPPAPPNPHSFLRVSRDAIASGVRGQLFAALAVATAIGSFLLAPKFGFVIAACLALVGVIAFGGLGVWLQLDAVREQHPAEAIAGVRSVLRVLVLFALVTPFWSLFDQKASTWVLQANAMTKPNWFQPAQMQALNPALVMLLIPFNNLVLYPAIARLGYELTALRRMTAGIAFAGLSWIVVGAMQLVLDHGRPVHDHLASAALCSAHIRRSTGRHHRTRIRLQPGAARDERSDHGLLESVGHNRQPLGLGGERRCAKLGRHEVHRVDGCGCERISNVLLRSVRLCRCRRLRPRRPHLSHRRSLSQRGDLTSCPLSQLLGGSLSPVRLQKSLITNVGDGASARFPVGKDETFGKPGFLSSTARRKL